jgi:hypothetical protein
MERKAGLNLENGERRGEKIFSNNSANSVMTNRKLLPPPQFVPKHGRTPLFHRHSQKVQEVKILPATASAGWTLKNRLERRTRTQPRPYGCGIHG